MKPNLTKAGQRRLKALFEENEPTINDDRQFFKQHPNRSYRVRPSSPTERQASELAGIDQKAPPPGWAWYTAIKQISPGLRLRAVIVCPAITARDVSEEEAQNFFKSAVGNHPVLKGKIEPKAGVGG